MLSLLARRALTAAALAAASAVGTYVVRRWVQRRENRSRRDEPFEVSRWEGEGGSPTELRAALPHRQAWQ